MIDFHDLLFAVLWLGWGLYWWAASRGTKTTVRHESIASRLAHLLPLFVAGIWMFDEPAPFGILGGRFLPRSEAFYWLGAALTAAGLAFCVWARVFLAGNWSGTVTVKADHELVRGGPYRFVRHPIYTGLILAFLGSAIARGEWRGFAATALVWAALWRKLRLEERWMIETFGEAYRRFQREVPALIPRPRAKTLEEQ